MNHIDKNILWKTGKQKKPDDKKARQQAEDPAVQRGKAAIEAARLSNPKPASEQEKEDREDAEKWRNEG